MIIIQKLIFKMAFTFLSPYKDIYMVKLSIQLKESM